MQGFTQQGDLIVDKGWIISRDFGHIAYGYAVTSHAAQGKTVDKVFISLSSDSFPAINQRVLVYRKPELRRQGESGLG